MFRPIPYGLCQAGRYWRIHQLFPPEPGSRTMGHIEQCHSGPGAPGLAKRLGTGRTRHLERFNCQETQIQRQQDRLMAQENMGVSDDSCQQSQKNEPSEGKNVILHRNWWLLRPALVFQAAEWTSGWTERHCSKGPGPPALNLHSVKENNFPSEISKVHHSTKYHLLYSNGVFPWKTTCSWSISIAWCTYHAIPALQKDAMNGILDQDIVSGIVMY